ncbi:MAG TPA: Uma2 family endonuclease, partial [Nostocaceae cyanobacterium]|nr:Uma2 family endonuclease [Nostocaceae cyanobacterium]
RGREYVPVTDNWLAGVELGLCLWEGVFEGVNDTWLRWCDAQGNVIPTGAERAEQEKQAKEVALQQAEQEKQAKEAALQRAERLAAQLKALGIEPEM